MNRITILLLALLVAFMAMGQSECVGNDPTPTPTPSATPTPTTEPTPTATPTVTPSATCIPQTWYIDYDSDSYGSDRYTVEDCTEPQGYVDNFDDCDDTDPDVSPIALEVCDGIDNNCTDGIDEPSAIDALHWFEDNDSDNYGENSTGTDACYAPTENSVTVSGDCNDSDSYSYPGAHDICNDGVDQDCDGESKECLLTGDYELDEIGFKLTGDTQIQYSNAGSTVASAGDVNADGYDDILVGVEYTSEVGAYLVYGGTDLYGTMSLADADVKFIGTNYSSFYPTSVASAGDFNGDGYKDIMIWSHAGDESYNQSATYLVYGPVSGTVNLASQTDVKFIDDSDRLSRAIASAGDVNADGYDDILIGTTGGVRLVYGDQDLYGTMNIADADVKFINEAGDALGDRASVSTAGDVNADGYDDILIGSSWNDDGNSGIAYIIYGRSDLNRTISLDDAANVKFIGEAIGDYVGDSVSAGDVNMDGYSDILIGASGNDEGGVTAGAAYLIYGPMSGTINLADADAKIVGANSDSVGDDPTTIVNDVNADGYLDILLNGYSSAVYLVYGPISGSMSLADADAKFVGEANSNAGESFATAGDVNADGFDDILVGAPWDNYYVGAVYLVYGGGNGN